MSVKSREIWVKKDNEQRSKQLKGMVLLFAFLDGVLGSFAWVQNAAAEGLLKMPKLSSWRHCTRVKHALIMTFVVNFTIIVVSDLRLNNIGKGYRFP